MPTASGDSGEYWPALIASDKENIEFDCTFKSSSVTKPTSG